MTKKAKSKNQTPIQLGNKVRDIVSGFTGIATSKVEYLNGCVQFCVKPPVDADNKMLDGTYIDVQQLEYVDNGVAGLVEKFDTGGDMRDAPKY